MLYSVSYQSSHKDEADEIRCPVNKLGYILNFIKEHSDKRYNVSFEADTEQEERLMKSIDILRQIAPSYTIACASIPAYQKLKAQGYNAYIAYPATDWETYQGLREAEVSDILIDGPLGFQTDKLIASKGDIKIRAVPNASPNSALCRPAANFFFIRPEDQSAYESALDILELNDSSQDKEDTLFAIYKRQKFDYELNKLITNFPYDINNHFFKPDFVQPRLVCGQRCKIPNHSCHLCDNNILVTKKAIELVNAYRK